MKSKARKPQPGQHDGESAFEYLKRVVNNLDYETCSMTYSLPSVEAVLDFFDLWRQYGTDLWEGVMECIAEGDDAEPAIQFARKYKLTALYDDIQRAMRRRMEAPV